MENNMEKSVEETTETPVQEQTECSGYTDPNEGVKEEARRGESGYGYSYVHNPADASRQYTYYNGQQFQNGGYPQHYYNYEERQMDTSPMSMGDWLLTILAALIPCAGVILYFVWAFGSGGNINRRNYSRAMLIVMGGLLLIYVMIFMITGVIGMDYYYYY